MKRLISLTLFLFVTLNIYADEQDEQDKQDAPEELSGTIIGTEKCIDYKNNAETTTVNTATNLFDNSVETFFATYQYSGGWAGLDLEEKHIITSIAYFPRKGQDSSMLLGVFEGANNPDFGDAIPLFLITETPGDSIMTEKEINCSRSFRYVRYVGPDSARCNIAELKFFGYKGEGDDSQLPAITNIPTVVIHTVNAEDIVVKEKYIKGIVSVISEGGTKIHTDSLDIRGRGNNSWTYEKKPYRMKLYNKVSLLNLPAKEKNWTLINNYGDKTLMRNLLAFDLSKRFELEYTPAGVPVNVFLNGEYKGCYQLCDQIEVETGRVDVEKMKITDINLPALSGGYLIEIDGYAYQESSWFTSALNGTPVTIKYPKDDEIVMAQYNYIKKQFNALENAVFSTNFSDPQRGYRRYLDTKTFIRHFLVNEISGNTDTYWSTYMYKRKNDEHFFVGPVWDFDLAYDNTAIFYPIDNSIEWIYSEKRKKSVNGMKEFVNKIMSDSSFFQELKETYKSYRSSEVISVEALFKVVDDYAEELEQSQQLNFMRWKIMNKLIHENPVIHGSYEAEVNSIKSYIERRIKRIDEIFEYDHVPNEHINISHINVWSSNNNLCINGMSYNASLYVYDLTGKTIYSGIASESFTHYFNKGFYIVKVVDKEHGIKLQKIIIN